jgi:seryl-tRNA synthetase
MLDIRWMRENREALAEAMRKLNVEDAPWPQALELDQRRRQILTQVEALRAELNSGSRDIGKLFREKRSEEANTLKARMTEIGGEIEQLDAESAHGGNRLPGCDAAHSQHPRTGRAGGRR